MLTTTLYVVGTLVALFFAAKFYVRYLSSHRWVGQVTGLHQEPQNFPFGQFRDVVNKRNWHEMARDDIFSKLSVRSYIGWFLTASRLFTATAELNKSFLARPDRDFIRPPSSIPQFNRMVHGSILGVGGDDWVRQHRLLGASFSLRSVKNFLPIINEEAERVVEQVRQTVGKQVCFSELLTAGTLKVVARAVFGLQSDDSRLKSLISMYVTITESFTKPHLVFGFMKYFNFGDQKILNDAFATVYSLTDSIIAERKKVLNDNYTGRRCLLDLMIEASENDSEGGLSTYEVRQNCLVFMFAGHETTSWSLAWFFNRMITEKGLQEKVGDEVLKAYEESEDLDVAKNMPFTKMAVHESLRLNPSVTALFSRKLITEMKIGPTTVPAGAAVSALVLSTHYSEDDWGPTYLNYDPEHFSKEAMKKRSPFSFLAFGAGRRSCIGKYFALEEMYIFVAQVMKNFTFEYPVGLPPAIPIPKPPVTHVKGGLQLIFKERVE
eukprot:TRINITY_DN3419_c0_g1_i1.p1 TRINITY_DN3419_c0_g1~~TRINITY_DN3419_c0_g1_i1.p1  ORF type:complete len:493 (+),score=105.17 TRINITY_DN3419_c0_g1_i1:91-1569(+)